jgi:hypothetical protein
MTSQLDEREFVDGLARLAVSRLAPNELPLFPVLSDRFGKDPDRLLRDTGGRDEVLGSGLEGAALLTPIALAAATEVAKYVAVHLAMATGKGAAELFRQLLHRPDEAPPALTAGQLAEVGRLAREKGLALRLSEARAGALADALVAALAIERG